MSLFISGVKEHKAFILKQPYTIDGNIIVLTGKNGSGKSRFLESLHNGATQAQIDGEIIKQQDISNVTHSSLIPNFGNGYNSEQRISKIRATLRLYDQIKSDLIEPYNQEKESYYNANRGRENALDYSSLFRLAQLVSRKLNKPANELSHDEIILHYEEPLGNILGLQNISNIFNQYIQRIEQNEINEWRNTVKGVAVGYLTHDEFISNFGGKPWERLNSILKETFDGKFSFNIPDEQSKSYDFQAQLIQNDLNIPVAIDALSSGEKTLLWLALTLFNSQYYDSLFVRVPKLLLIDEPDAFLHPKMVVKMYKVLESFNNNFNSKILITTHSPTTIALAPQNRIYIIHADEIDCVEKDAAIADLLDGITQISLSPENRRQVLVESQYDANIYHEIYSKLLRKSDRIDPKISLSFVSSGPKLPEQQLRDKIFQILKINDLQLIEQFIKDVNGVGSCSHVIGQVQSLTNSGNDNVRGIIDWDNHNQPIQNVSILAFTYAYSIENITLDPICILLLLHMSYPAIYTMQTVCGSDVSWHQWLKDKSLLQNSVDLFINKVLDRENRKDSRINYLCGISLSTDLCYLHSQGHELEGRIKIKYPQLNSFARPGKDGELKWAIVSKSMITYTDGDFIPEPFINVLASVQK